MIIAWTGTLHNPRIKRDGVCEYVCVWRVRINESINSGSETKSMSPRTWCCSVLKVVGEVTCQLLWYLVLCVSRAGFPGLACSGSCVLSSLTPWQQLEGTLSFCKALLWQSPKLQGRVHSFALMALAQLMFIIWFRACSVHILYIGPILWRF